MAAPIVADEPLARFLPDARCAFFAWACFDWPALRFVWVGVRAFLTADAFLAWPGVVGFPRATPYPGVDTPRGAT